MRRAAKQKRRAALFAWVRDQYVDLTAHQMAEAMTCEALPDGQMPFHFRRALTEFRRLRTDAARVIACRSYLERRRELQVEQAATLWSFAAAAGRLPKSPDDDDLLAAFEAAMLADAHEFAAHLARHGFGMVNR